MLEEEEDVCGFVEFGVLRVYEFEIVKKLCSFALVFLFFCFCFCFFFFSLRVGMMKGVAGL